MQGRAGLSGLYLRLLPRPCSGTWSWPLLRTCALLPPRKTSTTCAIELWRPIDLATYAKAPMQISRAPELLVANQVETSGYLDFYLLFSCL